MVLPLQNDVKSANPTAPSCSSSKDLRVGSGGGCSRPAAAAAAQATGAFRRHPPATGAFRRHPLDGPPRPDVRGDVQRQEAEERGGVEGGDGGVGGGAAAARREGQRPPLGASQTRGGEPGCSGTSCMLKANLETSFSLHGLKGLKPGAF